MPLILLTLGAVAYNAFTLQLLFSTPPDRKAGMLFLLNLPVFLVWGIELWRLRQRAAAFGVVACLVQAVITALMLLFAIGDWELVVLINGVIVFALAAITIVCWRYQPREVVETLPGETVLWGQSPDARERRNQPLAENESHSPSSAER